MSVTPDTFEPETVALAIAGERAAVTEIVTALLPRVYGLCLRIARRRDVADEATQETFVRALRALGRLERPGALVGWMLTIAANTTRELLRRAPREASLIEEPPAIEPATDDARALRHKAVEHAVAALPAGDRALFLLHTVEGVELSVLAGERGVSSQAMRSKVHRIRSKVRTRAVAVLQRSGAMP